jgi:hypothetical protein
MHRFPYDEICKQYCGEHSIYDPDLSIHNHCACKYEEYWEWDMGNKKCVPNRHDAAASGVVREQAKEALKKLGASSESSTEAPPATGISTDRFRKNVREMTPEETQQSGGSFSPGR